MANIRLYQFPSKASPVPADILYLGDSAASFDESNSTIAAVIAAYPNLSGIGGLTLGANTYPYSNNSAVITAGTITALGVSLLADSTITAMQSTLGYSATPLASRFSAWDVNSNLSANNFLAAYTATATNAALTTLSVTSTHQQFFTGSTTQTVKLPVTSTLVLGHSFYIVNQSSGAVTVQSSGGNTVQVMAANSTIFVTCVLTSGTTETSWFADYNLQAALTLPLSLANGGTNANLTASNGGIFYSTATAGAILSGTATAGQLLLSGSNAAPTWSTTTYPSTNAINTLLYASGANVMSALATANNGVLHTDGSGVPSIGTAPIAAGGTGVTSVTTVPPGSAAAWAGWDANKNLTVNSVLEGYAATVTAAGTTTLTVSSAYQQLFSGSTTQTLVLPVTSTLVLGQQYYVINNSSGAVTVRSSGANNIIVMAGGSTAVLTCILTSGTTAASWYADYVQSGLSLPVSLANGGTNASLTASNGGVVFSSASALQILSGTATAGLALLSGSSTIGTWSSSAPLLTGGGTMTGNIAFNPSTAGLTGTATNDDATSGTVGQFVSSVIAAASGVSLSNGSSHDITSISLGAGDWNVWGNITMTAISIASQGMVGWISSASATLPDSSLYSGFFNQSINSDYGICVPARRFSLSGTTTIYLSVDPAFSSGTAKGCGGIYARRIR